MELMVQKRFDAAHRLMNHSGKCSNLHGHSYVIEVYVNGPISKHSGMVADFGDIKKIIDPVIEEFDHACILNKDDKKFITFLQAEKMRLVIMNGEPTAENMCFEFCKLFRKKGLQHPHVRIFETPTNACSGA